MKRSKTTDADASAPPLPMLPEDVVFEILARLPVRSVLRCRSVCKAWLVMLSHPSFVRRHSDRSKENPSAVIVSTPPRWSEQSQPSRHVMFHRYRPGAEAGELLFEHALPDMGEPIICYAHCDGLLALYEGATYVCNPATRELVALPPCLPFDYDTEDPPDPYVGLCRDYRSGAYKVFHAFYYGPDSSPETWIVRVEVLTLGAENPQWRVLPSCVHCTEACTFSCIASIDGAVYFLFVDDNGASPSIILSLDACTEKFTSVPAPPSDYTCGNIEIMNLMEFRGKLCFCCGGSQSDGKTKMTEIWLMSGSPESPAWARYWSFSTNLFLAQYIPVLALNRREMMFRLRYSFYSYDPRSDMLNEVTDIFTRALNLHRYDAVQTYTESLVEIITTKQSRGLQPTTN